MKQGRVIFGIIIVSVLIVGVYERLNPQENVNTYKNEIKATIETPKILDGTYEVTDEKKSKLNEYEFIIEELGGNPETSKGEITQEEIDSGIVTKEVHEYRSLAEAEEDMGYFLGLRNDLTSLTDYQLVKMYNVGDKAWYQAEYENNNDSDDKIIVKTSKTASISSMKSIYTDEFKANIELNKYNTVVKIEGNNEKYNIASFETRNNKKYIIYSHNGLDIEQFEGLIDELFENLASMRDWI